MPSRWQWPTRAVVVVFVAGWLLTVAGFLVLGDYELRRRNREFQREMESHFAALQQVVAHHDQLLTAVQNLFSFSAEVQEKQFHGVLSDLIGPDSGLRAIHWVPRVGAEDRAAFETQAAEAGRRPIQIVERTSDGRVTPAARREEYFPVRFVEPFTNTYYVRGMDLGGMSEERELLSRSCDTGLGRAMLRRSREPRSVSTTELVVAMPVYRPGTHPNTVAARRTLIWGFVHALFDLSELWTGFTARFPAAGLDWAMYEKVGGTNYLVHSRTIESSGGTGAQLSWQELVSGMYQQKQFEVGGLNWVIGYRPSARWVAQNRAFFPYNFLLGSGLLTCLVCAYLTTLARRSRRIEQEVAARTAELASAKVRLEQSEARFRSYMDNSPAVTWLKDHEFRYRYLNAAFRKLFHVTDEYHTGKLDTEWLPAEVAARLRAHDQKVQETGQPLETVEQVPTPDGKMRHWLVTKFPFPGSDNQRWVGGTAFEISERVAAEQALRESQQRLELAIQGASLGVWDRNLQTGVTVFNDRWAEMLGFLPGELTPSKATWEGLLHPEDRDRVLATLNAHLEGRAPHYECEFRLQTKQGDWKWIAASGRVVEHDAAGRPLRFAGTHRDITAQKVSELALKTSELRFRSLVENAPMGVWQLGPDGTTIHYLNPALQRMLGIGPTEPVTELKMRSFIPREYHQELDAHLNTRAAGSTSAYEIEYVTRSGRRVPVLVFGAPLLTPEGRLAGTIGLSMDVSERKQAQEAVQQERNLLRTLIDHLPDCIYIKDYAGAFVLSNAAHLRQLGLPPDTDITGCSVFDFFPAHLARRYAADDRKVLETGEPVLDREEPFTLTDNRSGWYLTSKVALRDSAGHIIGLVGISRDITEEKRTAEEKERLQRKLEEAQKLESLGVLAGGIAHDFNNILTGILGNASLIKLLLPASSTVTSCAEEIEKASLRAADLCKQMLAYAGRGRFVVKKLQLHELIEDSKQLLEFSVSKNASFEYNLAPGLPPVSADATQLQQILMNLVINASEAIGEQNGQIKVSTGLVRADRAYLTGTHLAPELPEGDYVYLEVSDTGCGMDKETVAKIFDPFFTTKFLGRGLGLAAVLGIVRSHKGALKVYSEPGQGSSFRLLLPVAEGRVEPATAAPASGDDWRGSGKVLVVDDEKAVRVTTGRLLESFGFQVLLAVDGEEGVEMFRTHRDAIALVILDLTMPKKDGVVAFQEIHALNSNVPVLLMSGFSEEDAVQHFTGAGLAGFIQKPFRTDALRLKIREVLGAGPPAVG